MSWVLRGPQFLLALAAAIPVAFTGGCDAGGGAESSGVGAARNLLLITVDTLRADHLEPWGYARATSPFLNAWAQDAALFERAYSTSSWTLPSFASLMTSALPSTHRATNMVTPLGDDFPTLAEQLAGAGFHTGAVVSHVFVGERYGFAQGFADFDQDLVLETPAQSHRAITSPAITERACAWLAERGAAPSQRWFLWLHYFDPHSDYQVHAGVSEPFGTDEESDRYDGEIAFTDRHLAALWNCLEEAGQADETLVVFLSDHGEEFRDHGQLGHNKTLYEEVFRVPLAFRGPGVLPGAHGQPVSLIDVAPTVYELLDVAPPADLVGASLAAPLGGGPVPADEPPHLVIGELGRYVPGLEALVEGPWKLVLDRPKATAMLFHLERDPLEKSNLAADEPERVEAMRARLDAALAEARAQSEAYGAGPALELSPAARDHLRALGYVEGQDGK